ncbi:hypothetical protein K7432_016074 [Basidiobolus ranarum]|uniref:Uncharacterized protein n=1 Tax=Basidiobolus ranarum TaxID=34480 RepID=A0ABR2WF99_9FUNG
MEEQAGSINYEAIQEGLLPSVEFTLLTLPWLLVFLLALGITGFLGMLCCFGMSFTRQYFKLRKNAIRKGGRGLRSEKDELLVIPEQDLLSTKV